MSEIKVVCLLCFICLFSSCKQPIDERITNIESSVSNIELMISGIKSADRNIQPRYQIIQSTIAAKGTFKLDAYTGDVFQMVLNKNDESVWRKLNRNGHYSNDHVIENRINYSIFTSTIALRHTYLINVNTGATWQIFRDTDTGKSFFGAIF